MRFKEWILDYPMLIPCIYCDYWRSIGEGRKLTIREYANLKKHIDDCYDYTRLPCCWYEFIFNYKSRGDPPVNGKCAHFKAKHMYEYLQEVLSK